jgi:hypothetical protein
LSAQEEDATKDDDATIPYHLWNSLLTRLWDTDIPPPTIGKPAEVIREKFALRFWKVKVRRSFFAWFSKEFHFRQDTRSVVSWDGTGWGDNQNGYYIQYWSAMWGDIDNEKQMSLVVAADCSERAI